MALKESPTPAISMHASQGGKQEEGGGGQEAFKGSVESAKTFVAVVSGIFNGKRDQHAHIVANSNGTAQLVCVRAFSCVVW